METRLVALQIELTNACKLACAECPRILMSRPVGVMKLELAKLLVDEGVAYNPTMGFNVNGLGEPLLYPHFAALVEHMDSVNAHHIDLFTSLIAPDRLVDRAFDALAKTKMRVQLCVTKHLYDNHGKRQFEDAEFDRNLLRVVTLPGQVDRHIGIVCTKYHTQADIEEFEARYKPMFPEGNFHVIRQLNPWFNLVSDMAGAAGPSPPARERNICDYPFILMHVGWNGDVIVCCTDDVDGECVLGHFSQPGDLHRIWHGPELEEMRRKHREYIIDMKPCDKCERTAWARLPQTA